MMPYEFFTVFVTIAHELPYIRVIIFRHRHRCQDPRCFILQGSLEVLKSLHVGERVIAINYRFEAIAKVDPLTQLAVESG